MARLGDLHARRRARLLDRLPLVPENADRICRCPLRRVVARSCSLPARRGSWESRCARRSLERVTGRGGHCVRAPAPDAMTSRGETYTARPTGGGRLRGGEPTWLSRPAPTS